ncbi:trichohyalin isoform X1 [Cynara cardunculus var. scolymus]|uniref:trichohyalin isoform X1 n=1 Tax=Cynara cardunculus var. scolymus TaxID=59895 RepID=UPI000D62CB87|nr:trichohyalin isoform X1 [Cynara cardunculus var. scolymus]XP_024969399.1 trichohyalin isoform X1 [Cynara cardunculus var. scolymus]XP_024969407.1 trichohyalin isoform X1 [Cynara cardunculus var. scolymus]
MNEKWITGSCMGIPDEKSSSLYPMLFSVSCALFSLKHSSGDERKRTEITDSMLHGGASLISLLLWRVQREEQVKTEKFELLSKLNKAETEIEELKRRRVEDAKANEKVVSIFAAHEQRWLMERKKLTQHIRILLNELRVINTKREENASKLSDQLQEKEKLLEEEKQKRIEQEETVQKTERTNEELREMLKREAQEHSKEIWKHKSAFIELVSTQRQLEAEMGRAVRQVEAEKQELDAVLEQKEQYVLMTQKLSMELIKTRKDLEQKDKILSAMLRKSKMDTAEKQMLLKEVKMSKSKRQQAALETEKSRMVPETRHERYSLRSMLSRHHKFKPEPIAGIKEAPSGAVMPSRTGSQPTNLLEYKQSEFKEEQDVTSPFSQQTEASEELVLAADISKLEGWVQCEAEKCITILEQRHQLEVNAFAEQLRLKDEKLEAFRWHSLSMDIELKRLHSHIEGLGHDLTKLKERNLKVEALLLDRESELHALKEQMKSELQPRTPKSQISYSNTLSPSHPLATAHVDGVWSNDRIIKRKPGEKEKDLKVPSEEIFEESAFKDALLTVQSPDKEFEDKKDIISVKEECARKKEILNAENMPSSTWKMDLHALGVFYKIKRLNQQLLMFERLTGKQESCENSDCDDKSQFGVKGFYGLMSLVNKQVSRYQSLQEKANDICKRMHENDQDASRSGSFAAKSKDETKKLEHFLEETFQLQRYIVATGQKLIEIQSKIASGFVGAPDDGFDGCATSFDMKKFADCLRSLFREVQRGLEVRISRIIGDLEGPLAWDGMIHPRT